MIEMQVPVKRRPEMISLLLPSRKRPQNLMRLFDSVRETADNWKDIELIVALDDDDDSYHTGIYKNCWPKQIKFRRFPRMVLSQYWNECYESARGDILMHCGDDIVFRTPGWDTKVKAAFDEYPDKIVFVYGNDGSGPNAHDGRFGTHGFIHRRWVNAVGYFVPPYFSSDWNDTWLNDVAKMIGRHKHIDILTEHMHPDFGKAELDETHRERIARGNRDGVMQIYFDKLNEREIDASRLRSLMNE